MLTNIELGSVANVETAKEEGDLAVVEVEMSTRTRADSLFNPHKPTNTPAILTYTNVSVTTRSNPPKLLLNNVHGAITGGFWAIMGKCSLDECFKSYL